VAHRWGLGAALAVGCVALIATARITDPASAATGATAPVGPPALTFQIYAHPATRLNSNSWVGRIANGFVGVSMDYCATAKYMADGAEPVLAHLVLGLSPQPVVRIGGNGPDMPCTGKRPRPIPPEAELIASLARATGAHLILGINLVAHDAVLAAIETKGLVDAIERRAPFRYIQAFEIGNEPDRYVQYGAKGSTRASAIRFDFHQYLDDFTTWAYVIRVAAQNPRVAIAGPSLGRIGLPWLSEPNAGDFGQFLRAPAKPTLITFHTYPLHGTSRCPASDCPSIQNLLAPAASTGPANEVARFVGSIGWWRQLRVDEMNSVTGGGAKGVSNTFASALWALDTLFELAQAGVSGVNVHTFPSARYELYTGPRGGWRVFPEYYGLLAFERAAPAGSQLLEATGGRADPELDIWGVRQPSGRLVAVAINKSPKPVAVHLTGAGVPAAGSAQVAWLQAAPTGIRWRCPPGYASTGLCATGGVSLGGASFGPEAYLGGDRTRTGVLGPARRGTCTLLVRCDPQPAHSTGISLTLPGGTAVLVSGR
jgi:hypothetical protein